VVPGPRANDLPCCKNHPLSLAKIVSALSVSVDHIARFIVNSHHSVA
jgi:hypothetical protein